jgi:hypothetical protein
LLTVPLSSCLIRRRVVTRQGKHDTRPLLTATKEDLLARTRAASESIRSFSATLDMTPAIGSVYRGGDITEFPAVRGYVLFKKPDEIRIIGLDPVIHSKAFDMVSTGADFKLYIPSKNLFVTGSNNAPPAPNPKNKLENLRPVAFSHSMVILPPDPALDKTVMADDTDEEHSFYWLLILRGTENELHIDRAFAFDRLTLQIVQQRAYDAKGSIVSDTRYSGWTDYGGISYPSTIDINRPQDGYGVVMKIVEMKMNTDLTTDKFDLPRPDGTDLKSIGSP